MLRSAHPKLLPRSVWTAASIRCRSTSPLPEIKCPNSTAAPYVVVNVGVAGQVRPHVEINGKSMSKSDAHHASHGDLKRRNATHSASPVDALFAYSLIHVDIQQARYRNSTSKGCLNNNTSQLLRQVYPWYPEVHILSKPPAAPIDIEWIATALDSYIQAGRLEEAEALANSMGRPAAAISLLAAAYTNMGDYHRLTECILELQKTGTALPSSIFAAMMYRCLIEGRWQVVLRIRHLMNHLKIKDDEMKALDLFAAALTGHVDYICHSMAGLQGSLRWSGWLALLTAYGKTGQLKDLWRTLQEMAAAGHPFDANAVAQLAKTRFPCPHQTVRFRWQVSTAGNAVVIAYCHMLQSQLAMDMMRGLEEAGFEVQPQTFAALLEAYTLEGHQVGHRGGLDRSYSAHVQRLFSWSIQHRFFSPALQAAEVMLQFGILPDLRMLKDMDMSPEQWAQFGRILLSGSQFLLRYLTNNKDSSAGSTIAVIARMVFSCPRQTNVELLEALVKACGRAGLIDQMEKALHMLWEMGAAVEPQTLAKALAAYLDVPALGLAAAVVARLIGGGGLGGLQLAMAAYKRQLVKYMDASDWGKAQRLLSELTFIPRSEFRHLIRRLARLMKKAMVYPSASLDWSKQSIFSHHPWLDISLTTELHSSPLRTLNNQVLADVVYLYAQTGQLARSIEALLQLHSRDNGPLSSLYSAVLTRCLQLDDVQQALYLFARFKGPSLVFSAESLGALCCATMRSGYLMQTAEVVGEMLRHSLLTAPDVVDSIWQCLANHGISQRTCEPAVEIVRGLLLLVAWHFGESSSQAPHLTNQGVHIHHPSGPAQWNADGPIAQSTSVSEPPAPYHELSDARLMTPILTHLCLCNSVAALRLAHFYVTQIPTCPAALVNAVAAACGRAGLLDEMDELLHGLTEKGLSIELSTHHAALQAYLLSNHLDLARQTACHLLATGAAGALRLTQEAYFVASRSEFYKLHPKLLAREIKSLSSEGLHFTKESLSQHIPGPIARNVEDIRWLAALNWRTALQTASSPDPAALLALVRLLSSSNDYNDAALVLRRLYSMGYCPVPEASAVLMGYLQQSALAEAQEWLHTYTAPAFAFNSESLSAMCMALLRDGQMEQAELLLGHMRQNAVHPDIQFLKCLAMTYAKNGQVTKVQHVMGTFAGDRMREELLQEVLMYGTKATMVQQAVWLMPKTTEGTALRHQQRLESVARMYQAFQRLAVERERAQQLSKEVRHLSAASVVPAVILRNNSKPTAPSCRGTSTQPPKGPSHPLSPLAQLKAYGRQIRIASLKMTLLTPTFG